MAAKRNRADDSLGPSELSRRANIAHERHSGPGTYVTGSGAEEVDDAGAGNSIPARRLSPRSATTTGLRSIVVAGFGFGKIRLIEI